MENHLSKYISPHMFLTCWPLKTSQHIPKYPPKHPPPLTGLFAISVCSEGASGRFVEGLYSVVRTVFGQIVGRFVGQIFEQMFGQVFFTRVLARVLTRVWGREKPCTQCTVLPGLRKNMQRPQKPSKTSNASPP